MPNLDNSDLRKLARKALMAFGREAKILIQIPRWIYEDRKGELYYNGPEGILKELDADNAFVEYNAIDFLELN